MKTIPKIIPGVRVVVLMAMVAYLSNGCDSNQHERRNMQTVTSKDGTKIAYDKSGSGHAVILIGGALVDRSDHEKLAKLLSKDFTVYNYDRRGRGDSGDTKPYAVER